MSAPSLSPESSSELFAALSLAHSHERERALANWHDRFGNKLHAHSMRTVLAGFDGVAAAPASAVQ